MGWPQCNTTLEDEKISETPLFNTHDFTFHALIKVIAAICGVIAIVVSFFLMFMHATHYSRPKEQRYIIRILFMVPVYALVSFLSIQFYYHSVYYEVLRDCYEAFAIASFFSLLCSFLADDLHEQKEYFRKIKPKAWIWPMGWLQKCCGGERGCLRTPRSGLTWFNVIWVAVFQYCFIRVSMTITAVVTQHFDRYCLESLNPAFAHVWVIVIEAIAVTITMYCIIQFYVQIREDIKQHSPILKVLAIKLVIFLSFWQTILISFLTSSGAINASDKIQTPDIKVGIPSLLLCIEMAIFAFFHLWSFSYKPYVIGSQQYLATYGDKVEAAPEYHGGPLGLKAAWDCFNAWDLVKATGRSAKWLFRDRKHRTKDASYESVTSNPLDSQKMDDLNGSTAYGGAGAILPTTRPPPPAGEEGSGLLAGAQQPGRLNPYAARESESSGHTPWTEVEAKEYFQDQEARNHYQNHANDFHPPPTNPYTQQWQDAPPYGAPQQSGILRPAGTGLMPPSRAGGASSQDHLPVVTRQDIEDMQQHRGAVGQAVPYPRSMASMQQPPERPTGRGNDGGHSRMPSLPSNLRPGGR